MESRANLENERFEIMELTAGKNYRPQLLKMRLQSLVQKTVYNGQRAPLLSKSIQSHKIKSSGNDFALICLLEYLSDTISLISLQCFLDCKRYQSASSLLYDTTALHEELQRKTMCKLEEVFKKAVQLVKNFHGVKNEAI